MAYRPVGIDANDRFAPDVIKALADDFVAKPLGISNGQVPVWDASTGTWVAGAGGGNDFIMPGGIDGGFYNPDDSKWETGSGWTTVPDPTPSTDLDGGTPLSN